MYFLPPPGGNVLVLLANMIVSVCLSVCPSDYSKSNERICIKLSPEVCFGPRNNRLNWMIWIMMGMQNFNTQQTSL